MAKMTKSELKAIVNSEKRAAMGYMGGELSEQRADAMDYYLGEPFGNEQEGRSQVVSTDVAETIEWIMPSLMRIFTTSDEAVRFDPQGPEDEAQSRQETDYCNYIFYKKNPGFLIAYTWMKDALLQKNGIVKTYAEKEKEREREEYAGLTEQEFMLLLNDPELEPKEHEERVQTYEINGEVVEEIVHDVVFDRTCEYHKIELSNVPPEEFLISPKTNSVDPKKAPFVAHRKLMTISELREEGYSSKILEKIGSDTEAQQSEEWWARNNLTDETDDDGAAQDESMRRVWVEECYIRVDYNGDGIAELRKVTLAGNEILDNEEVDRIPFCAITPIILTHKFFGLSVADLIMDLQLIKSTIWRQMLDNMYLANNQMIAADYKNVNLDDLTNRSPLGTVRTKGPPQNSIMPIPHQPLPGDAFSMMDYIDNVKESRTGVGKQFQGLNADTLKDANIPAVHGLVTAAQQRVEMIARIFAETGWKEMFKDIHELTRKYPNKPEVVKLRNEWVEVDPREWKKRLDMTINVGLGTASQDAQLMNINQVIGDMKEAASFGGFGQIVNMQNFYKAAAKKTKLLGFKNVDDFWIDPEKNPPPPPPPPPPDPSVIIAETQYKIDSEKRQVELQKQNMDYQLKVMEMQFKADDSIRKSEIEDAKRQVEIYKIEMQAQTDGAKTTVQIENMDVDGRLKELQMYLDEKNAERATALEQYKADLAATVQSGLGELKAATDMARSEMDRQHQLAMRSMNDVTDKLSKQEQRESMREAEKASKKTPSEVEVEYDEDGKIISVNGKKVKRKRK